MSVKRTAYACVLAAIFGIPVSAAADEPAQLAASATYSKPGEAAVSFGFWGPTLRIDGEERPMGFVGSRLPESLSRSPAALEGVHRYRVRRTWGIATWSAAMFLSALSVAGAYWDVGPLDREERFITGAGAGVLLGLLGGCLEGSANAFLVQAVEAYNADEHTRL